MGRNWKRNRKNKHSGKPNVRKPADPSKYGESKDPYSLVASGNFKLEAFYACQGSFVKCETNELKEEERKRWLTSMKSTLPASFRIGSDVDEGLRQRLEKELEDFVGKKMEIEVLPKGGERRIRELDLRPEKKMISPAKKIPFVPFAYQLSLDRQTIRRNASLNPFHEWLKVQTEAGFVTRQETVSMLPPVVLNPERNNLVLDMCAAPGSKTSQLLEIINLPARPTDSEPAGCVVANDADNKRAYMLVHQLRRINSPAVFVTNCDAQFFPLVKSEDNPTEGMFDRVLCDVPCSGDGTSRKNPGVWKKWNSLNAYGLHALQLSIALKGARLTKVGGYLCYSTCSMNPIENESVVAEVLRASEGSLELVDRRSELPGLLARRGLATWRVLSEEKSRRQIKDRMKKNNDKMKARRKEWEEQQNDGEDTIPERAKVTEDFNGMGKAESMPVEDLPIERVPVKDEFKPLSMDDVELMKMAQMAGLNQYSRFEEVPLHMQKRVRRSCFPPTAEEVSLFHLEHCMRVLPHDMDTGGFFVALLRKTAPISSRAKKTFQMLQEELQTDNNDIGEAGEPLLKRTKLDSTHPVEENEIDGNEKKLINTSEGKNAISDEKDVSAAVRGHVKKYYLADKDGKKHPTLGRDDFIPVPKDIFEPLKDYYGLASDTFDEGQYMGRACGDSKGLQERITVVTSGVKGFVRNNKECEVDYRISQDGVHFVAPHMKKRKIGLELKDFETCLQTETIPLESFSRAFAEAARSLTMGSFVVYLKGFEDDYIKKFWVVMWRCRGDSVNCLVTKAELDGMKSKVRSVIGQE
eukprot:scaffold16189_cov125-Cylindrotheca_fusiformis.AAC.13